MNKSNPVFEASHIGQSMWLDFLSRELLDSGRFDRYLQQGLRGVTSNPKIFASAISEGSEYDETIQRLARAGKSPLETYEQIAVEDIQRTADTLRPHFEQGLPHDGFVSLEVSPRLAYDEKGTIEEARRLWRAVDRPNVMIKVPATEEGLKAIRLLISEGVNVNVTLLFGVPRYREVAMAYIQGIEEALEANRDVSDTYSVASFFLSRIDVLVDSKLDAIDDDDSRKSTAKELRGSAAIASAKTAYKSFLEIFGTSRFQKIADRGAGPQRLLWGSTSVKDPAYDDLMYANALVGPDTVDTLPEETFEAFVGHGRAENALSEGLDEAEKTLERFSEVAIDMGEVTDQLVREGVDKFNDPFDELISGLERKMAA